MVCRTIHAIKAMIDMQVDTFTFFFFCYPFVVYNTRVISMVTVKEIVFNYLIYVANVYHQSEYGIRNFEWMESCCDLGGGMTTWFQESGQIVMHILLFEEDHKSICFGKICVSCTCP